MIIQRRRHKWTVGNAVICTLLFVVSLITVYPFWHVLMYSFSDSKLAMGGGLFLWPRGFSLNAYRALFETRQIYVVYGNTLWVTGVGTLLSITLTVLLAYPLTVQRVKGRRLISAYIFFTMLFSGGMIPTFLQVQRLGLLDSLWALVIPGCVSAYNVFILRNFMQGIPASLEESANIDGASSLRVLVSVILPLSKPAIAAVSLFYGVTYWNSYLRAVLYINSQSKEILQQYLRTMMTAVSALGAVGEGSNFHSLSGSLSEESVKMVTIAASVIPVLIVYPWLQRYYVSGVTLGAIKE